MTGLWAVLVPAAALYTWNLSSLTGNSFYDVAVYSGTKSWKAFFFGALDSGSFITVDKPPFALGVMGLSARLFGYGTWQLVLPMAAAGVGSVAVLHRLVKRDFGRGRPAEGRTHRQARAARAVRRGDRLRVQHEDPRSHRTSALRAAAPDRSWSWSALAHAGA
ncbi:hypothetical protein AQI88_13705 [Streptomyces cellostaticus]|uniref:Glycosyltransferase RgtA/B/C/D-like domain-containing protein n=1 Tax=Streptomyces cellostaticus TaxID=67285 RepID=A0A101NN65_9ACTN|nr:hypothetical protein AQI88_13705 [Streptomyces cellostaticus]GHI02399.1 hypothetical protein Scel_07200 [Streptomyces cellostaticus]